FYYGRRQARGLDNLADGAPTISLFPLSISSSFPYELSTKDYELLIINKSLLTILLVSFP
ncbi:MAG: hypothetical protein KAJ79_08985, partial [Candidatus Omnitrophica bacterium]|nr:hypothetical protein [Candidatus Omnitrophota bacterium]